MLELGREARIARATRSWLLLPALASFAAGCASVTPPGRELVVTATAYNALPEQTDRSPEVGAWGDRLRPGMRAVAVSRDLVALGLVRGTSVRIEGLRGEYEVLDTMPARWRRRIDIFMGTDRRAARSWGKRTVRIQWAPPGDRLRRGWLCQLTRACG
jgi:3D (Asp-Asp-Asp) domain-containing protein